jgi:uncharacterized membrane protein (UPF0182 family)
VRPFYAQGRSQGSYPQFQFVVVYTQDKGAVCAQSVNEGLQLLFGDEPATVSCNELVQGTGTSTGGPSDDGSGDEPTQTTSPAATSTTQVPGTLSTAELLDLAEESLDQADAARLAGNLGEYQRLVEQAHAYLRRANAG